MAIVALGLLALGAGAAEKELTAGTDLSAWRKPLGTWSMVGEAAKDAADEKKIATKEGKGVLFNGNKSTVDLISADEFGDCQVHVEFMVPKGSNSGVYFMGRYEIQILDSFGVKKPGPGDCGGIYERYRDKAEGPGKPAGGFEGRPPRVNASLPPGEWQSFDITFKAPRFDKDGKKTANAVFVKVIHNGKVIHENEEVSGPTVAAVFGDEKPTGPLMLQGDHGPVAYRNIRVATDKAQ
jgi:hypothetical protein